MRNQRRKLFPDLFDAYRKFLEKSGRNDVYLYCHTSYPDLGWDIPKLLNKYKIASKTLFTYSCADCNSSFPAFFSDAKRKCKICGSKNAGLASVQKGASYQYLSSIINLKTSSFKKSNKVKSASKKEIVAMVNLCIQNLEEINFFKSKEKKPIMLENLRNIFYRMELSAKEARILSGVFASLVKKR